MVTEPTLTQAELIERVGWLIRLRWLAVGGAAATILSARAAFDAPLPWGLLLGTVGCIAAYNFVFYRLWRARKSDGADRMSSVLANAQISCDLLALGCLIHFSGGLENLFGVYFVFHVVIGGMLLSARATFAQTTLAIFIFAGLVLAEYSGIFPHYFSPIGIRFPGFHEDPNACLGAIWVMTTTLYVTAYFTTSVATALRSRESQVQQLTQRLQRRSDELEAANERISESEEAKSAYTRKVAHELRSPLAAIESLLRVVADGLQGEVPEQVQQTISRARHRARELLALVHDLLVLAYAQDVRQRGEWCDLDIGEVVGSVIHLLSAEAEHRSVTINCEIAPDLPKLCADREGMEEMLTNLISNAIRYSLEGGRVDVRVAGSAGDILITVSDTGIGIDEADLEKVFDEFYRSRSAREHTNEGTGLGLGIVKNIVESHGGRVSVESAKDKGTKFTVRIPIGRSAGPPPVD